ncbi:MAG TPA: hypothetical protein DDZ76_03380 [Xanthomonadales bacterium]|nr:hypothetical protein [Xanthomonadales bacterium]
MSKFSYRTGFPILCAVVLAACASQPPVSALQAADARLLAAREAGSGRFAAEESDRADRLLAAARLASDERRYGDAERLAERAEVEAELALALTRRAQVRAEVERKQDENLELSRELLGPEAVR